MASLGYEKKRAKGTPGSKPPFDKKTAHRWVLKTTVVTDDDDT